jgi:hypothetical protein
MQFFFSKETFSSKRSLKNWHLAALVAHPTFYPLGVRRQHVKANHQIHHEFSRIQYAFRACYLRKKFDAM